jgi:hypothetical protein
VEAVTLPSSRIRCARAPPLKPPRLALLSLSRDYRIKLELIRNTNPAKSLGSLGGSQLGILPSLVVVANSLKSAALPPPELL